VEPILKAWADDPTGPRPYSAGSWGPAAASALVARDGGAWAEEL
jgi:glucose-6-phosphate 1-dehydrogenase